ncbi:MAG: hypothetical protein JWN62_196 [Acidimicrobiales bacterium]|nr:hypothetical protein [Acidimicrobiales bacterium]
MNRISRAAVTVIGAGSLTIGGLAALEASGLPAHAASPLSAPSTRQALAISAVLSAPAAAPAETVTTLPLFGAPLSIDITSGPGSTIASIDVTPADGLTATADRPSKVRFVNAAGTAKVEVTSRGGGQNVEARAGQLSDVSGPGSWTGDVFGTGATTTVNFTTGAAADGSPTITGVTSSDASAVIGTLKVRSHDDASDAAVNVKFTNGIQARVLTIHVSVSTHDGESHAKVSVSLSRSSGRTLPVADVVGAQTWNGTLCDGTAASIAYTVNADGSITGASATPTADITQRSPNGIAVTFAEHEQVSIRVKSSDDATNLRVSVDERIRCDAADPAVNTPVSTTVPTSVDDHGNDQGGDGGGHHGGAGGDDGAPSSTTPTSVSANSTSSTLDDQGDDHGVDPAPPSTATSNTTPAGDDHGGHGHGSGSGSDDNSGAGGQHG